MMESPMTRNCHVGFGERYEETHQSQDWKVRFVPTPFSPLLANIALNGIEDIHQSVRYADDMVIILKPKDEAEQILARLHTHEQKGIKP
jgi:RNA-directed DNA polymerase